MKRTIEIVEKELEEAREENSKVFNDAPPNMNFDEFFEYMRPSNQKVSKLSREYRMLKVPEFNDIPDYADVYPIEDFIENCKCGGFIDYDGFGRYVRDGKESDIEIYPSDIKHNQVRIDFDSVAWYNR